MISSINKKCVPYLIPERTQYHVSNDIESTKSQISYKCIPKLFIFGYRMETGTEKSSTIRRTVFAVQ